MILTTGPGIEGRPISEYLGIVSSQAIMGVNIGKDLTAGLRNIVGGRSKSYEAEIAKAVDETMNELSSRAEQLGAQAVVSVDIDYETVGGDLVPQETRADVWRHLTGSVEVERDASRRTAARFAR